MHFSMKEVPWAVKLDNLPKHGRRASKQRGGRFSGKLLAPDGCAWEFIRAI
jgi:hypothetical protein